MPTVMATVTRARVSKPFLLSERVRRGGGGVNGGMEVSEWGRGE